MNIIVAVDKNYGIGRDGKLLFSIPEDMAFFRSMTKGKTVIMGRKTLESLPDGRPLKGRRNIVLSRDNAFGAENVEVVDSVEELLSIICDDEAAFVIGGESIYRALLPYCSRAYVTMVDAERDADRFFPRIEDMAEWSIASASEWKQHDGVSYQFREYCRMNADKQGNGIE